MSKRTTESHGEIAVILSSSDGKKSTGCAWVQEWNKKQRVERALKALGMLWGLGFVSILIPLLHFILVPGFLLIGPFVAFRIYQANRMIMGGTGTCPNCGKEFSIVKALLKWPLNDLCSACHSSVTIAPSDIGHGLNGN